MVSLKRIPGEPWRCPSCHEDYPLTAEYWYRRGTLWASHCKACRKIEDKAFKKARRMKKASLLGTYKRKRKLPPHVVVVEDGDGNRRALMYWQTAREDETEIGIGSHLLNL